MDTFVIFGMELAVQVAEESLGAGLSNIFTATVVDVSVDGMRISSAYGNGWSKQQALDELRQVILAAAQTGKNCTTEFGTATVSRRK